MSFKETIQADLSSIFFNLDEFAELHIIDGKEMKVIVDEDMLKERQIKAAEGVYTGTLLFHVEKSTFGEKPAVGQRLRFDNRVFTVNDFQDSDGMYTITLEGNLS